MNYRKFHCILLAAFLADPQAANAQLGITMGIPERNIVLAENGTQITLSKTSIKADGTVYGIEFTELNETPGKGSLAAEPAFKGQFNSRSVTSFKLNGSDDNGIDAITGATVTSSAVLDAVNAGLNYFHTVIMGGK